MWRGWNVRIKIVVLTMGVVLPVMAAATALTVRMSRTALEADIRNTGLAMARELAASAENEAGAAGEQQRCSECDHPFAAAMQMSDLKEILPQLGFDYALGMDGHYQDVCPACRRRLVTLAQTRRVGGFG